MRLAQQKTLSVFAACTLAACGGGNSGSSAGMGPSRGTLLQNPPELVATITAPSLLLELSSTAHQQLLSLSGTPLCDIVLYHLKYTTVGGVGEATTASGALMVPI